MTPETESPKYGTILDHGGGGQIDTMPTSATGMNHRGRMKIGIPEIRYMERKNGLNRKDGSETKGGITGGTHQGATTMDGIVEAKVDQGCSKRKNSVKQPSGNRRI